MTFTLNPPGTTQNPWTPAAVIIPVGSMQATANTAFARTLRSVVDGRGQFVTMMDRSYLMQPVPVQLIWGEEDFVIPVDHARIAHAAVPGSRLEIFENSGHLPFRDHPDRFVEVVERFIDSTQPADHDQDLLRSLLWTGIHEATAPEPVDAAPRGA